MVILVILIGGLAFSHNHRKAAMFSALKDIDSATCLAKNGGLECDKDELESTEWAERLIIYGFGALGVLHILYRFKKIHRIGSSFIRNIAISYVIFNHVLFAAVVWTMGDRKMSNFDAWIVIPLLTDMQKVARMAQFALSSSHSRRISENIANGMYVLAPTMSMDSLIKILLFSLGWQTGAIGLYTLAWYAVVSILVNCLVYLTFYPAGLSILLDLMCTRGRPSWDVRQIINTLPGEDGHSPVVHRVKVLVTAILSMCHICCIPNFIISADKSIHVEMAILITIVFVFFVRYFFYEDMDEAREMRQTYIKELTRKYAEDSEQNEFPSKEDMDRQSNSTDEGISVDSSSKPSILPSIMKHDDSGSESAWSDEVEYLREFRDTFREKEVQTIESFPPQITEEEEVHSAKLQVSDSDSEDEIDSDEEEEDEHEDILKAPKP